MKLIHLFSVLLLFVAVKCNSQGLSGVISNEVSSNTSRGNYFQIAIATSNAFAYIDRKYVPKKYNRFAYIAPETDLKTLKKIENTFKDAKINAINFYDLNCYDCTEERIKEILDSNGIDGFIKITFNEETQAGNSFHSIINQNVAPGLSIMNTTQSYSKYSDMYVYFYDNNFKNRPFIWTQVHSSSHTSIRIVPADLIEKNIRISIIRLVKKNYLLPNL